ncbi:MAG TPA: hypothetical protein VMU14_21670, partial [Acidimicrobiales bacterium]|nr:hypothetical protein [Acidimicrobiales bacterium]
MQRALIGAGTVLSLAVLVGACASSGPHASSATSVAVAATAATVPTTGAPAAAVTLGSSSAGPVLVDATGRTLYVFDKDTAGSGSSACNAACANAWPALTA